MKTRVNQPPEKVQMKQAIISTLIVILLLIIPACGSNPISVVPIPSHELTTPIKGTAAIRTQAAVSTQIALNSAGTAQAASATAVLEFQQAKVTGTADALATQAQETALLKATQTAQTSETASAEAILSATQTAQPMQALVDSLAKDGYLKTAEGTYYQIEPFDKSWAQLNWYKWWGTSYSPTNFVLHTHTNWWSASRKANWYASGCGFVFHEADEANHYFIGLVLNGNVVLHRVKDGIYTALGHNLYGNIDVPDGSAEVTLVMEDGWITFFVNGKKVLRTKDTSIPGGDLAFSLISGTNKDFGTRCLMTDTELWILK
jgi:hypothetical protein